MNVRENYQKIRAEIPSYVKVVVAAKTKTAAEIKEVIEAGATDIGENYVQETERIRRALGWSLSQKVEWHMIGHLQKNKINKALPIFDLIQTVDSLELAQEIDKRVEKVGKKFVPILLELNIGSEISKSGLKPEEHENWEEFLEQLVVAISRLDHIQLEGLMTMAPIFSDPEQYRPYFRRTKNMFDKLARLKLERVNMRYLSMGMSNSYRVAIEEGANMVRIGSAIFGPRERP